MSVAFTVSAVRLAQMSTAPISASVWMATQSTAKHSPIHYTQGVKLKVCCVLYCVLCVMCSIHFTVYVCAELCVSEYEGVICAACCVLCFM